MRALLFVLLCLAPALAWAQPTCWPAQAGGTGSPLVFKVDSACYAYGWRCMAAGQRHIVAGPLAAFPAAWREIGLALQTGTNADRTAAWAQYVTSNSVPAACASTAHLVRTQLYAEYLASVPAAVSYVVAPAASNANPPGTRPAFPFVDGKRIADSNGRATAGSACDCTVRDGDYCGVNGKTDQVALCVSAP